MWNHTFRAVLMSGRASETAVVDEKGGEVFREPCAVALQSPAARKHPEVGHKALQVVVVSSRSSSVRINLALCKMIDSQIFHHCQDLSVPCCHVSQGTTALVCL